MTRSSELFAHEMGLGPICDNCHMLLGEHGDTATGQLCDLALNVRDLFRVLARPWGRLLKLTTKDTP